MSNISPRIEFLTRLLLPSKSFFISIALLSSFSLFSQETDCNNDLNGSAYIDDCGNCVGGNTGVEACSFSPTVEFTLSNTEQSTLTDLTYSIVQESGEADIASSIVMISGGSFNIAELEVGQEVGFGSGFVAGGSVSGSFTLYVDFIISSDQATLAVVDNEGGESLGTFEIQNLSEGAQVLSTSPGDNNNTTAGNSQSVTLSSLFLLPSTSSITIGSTLNSEVEFVDVQEFAFNLDYTDCNNDLNGSAYIDDCGNCVGGNTGNLECTELNPSIEITLSNYDCDSTSDLLISVSQDANQADMTTSLLTSNGGSFDISSLTEGQNVGYANLSAAAGDLSFESDLYVSSIPNADQVILSAVNSEDNSLMGSFTISNNNPGIVIYGNPSYSDGNNVTAGNSSEVFLSNIFINPEEGSYSFFSSINAEVGPSNDQTIDFEILCASTCIQLGDANCDNIVNLADLSLLINNWLTETPVGENGDVIGSEDGFVNLTDLSLIINNWLQTAE
ncbi:MAG: hypothetical protein ACON4E_05555 [Flavobacteriales bacterium]